MRPLRLSLFALLFLAVLGMSQEAEAAADFDIYDIRISESNIYVNEPVQIEIEIGNGGDLNESTDVHVKIDDPEGNTIDWTSVGETKEVPRGSSEWFYFTWTPELLGSYGLSFYVDYNNTVEESNENNNEIEDMVITVYERFPDLQIKSVYVYPLDNEGEAVVGVESFIQATITNLGSRNMTESESEILKVGFYLTSPYNSFLGSFYVNESLDIYDLTTVTLPFIFDDNGEYRFVIKVDEDNEINEGSGGPELNNEAVKNIETKTSIDVFIEKLKVGDFSDNTSSENRWDVAGIEHPISFKIGVSNSSILEAIGNYRVFFNISVDGTFGWSERPELYYDDNFSRYALGTGYNISDEYAYIDFTHDMNSVTVRYPWIPNKDRTDQYNVSVKIKSAYDSLQHNNEIYLNQLTFEKLTTNLVIDAIKITQDPYQNVSTVKVTVGFPQGEQSQLDADVRLYVSRTENNDTDIIMSLEKEISGIDRGDSRSVVFAVSVQYLTGDYFFTARVDPDYKIKEIDRTDNTLDSKIIEYKEGCYDSNFYAYDSSVTTHYQKDCISPDLYISQISFSNDNPEQNETIVISASLKIAKMNLTDNKTEYIYLGFYQDNLNNEIDSIRVNASDLRKGIEFEKVVSTTWKATSGEYTIIAVADSTNRVKEGNEDGEKNHLSKDIYVTGKDGEVVIPGAPVALAGKDVATSPGSTVQFSGAGTDDDGTIVKYEWDFDGDGVFEWSSEENGVTTFIYNTAGTYTATLRVTDNDAKTDTDSLTVTVKSPDEEEEGIPGFGFAAAILSVGLIARARRD